MMEVANLATWNFYLHCECVNYEMHMKPAESQQIIHQSLSAARENDTSYS